MTTAWPPSTDQILDLVEGGVLQRADRYRFDLLSAAGAPLGEVHPDQEASPRVTLDTNRTVMRSLEQVRLTAAEAGAINTNTDRLRPVMVLQNGAEFSLGVFVAGDAAQPQRAWGDEQESQWVDLGHKLSFPYGRTTGSGRRHNIVQRAIDYTAVFFNSADIDAEPRGSVLKAPLVHTYQDTATTIVNAHLALVSYLPIHLNRDGRPQLRAAPVSLDTIPSTLSYGDAGRVERDSIVKSDDHLQAPNEFVVYDQSGANSPIRGVYRIPDSAPHSAASIGYVRRRVEAMTGLATIAEANEAARGLATTDKRSTYQWRTWVSSPDPRHDVFDVVRFYGINYLEVAWSISLVPGGLMTHQARRVF